MSDASAAALMRALERALGSAPAHLTPVAGGDINQAYEARLADGRRLFVKSHPAPPAGAFQAEAHGLAWLRRCPDVAVPTIVALGAVGDSPAFLVLPWIEAGVPSPPAQERLGRSLASLHAASPECFGLERDNFIGTLPQHNARRESWPRFYADARLAPRRDAARPLLGAERARALDVLCDGLRETPERFTGPPEAAARLHGDLWGGNVLFATDGTPWLIDPAVYGGHREVDLAMMRLFGGFSERCFAAYREVFPLAPDWERRVPLYQLYPLLVHVTLFGASYLGSVDAALRALRDW